MGGEAWASDALRRDKMQSNKTDDFTEEWATPIPPIPLEDVGGEFEGQLEDMAGPLQSQRPGDVRPVRLRARRTSPR